MRFAFLCFVASMIPSLGFGQTAPAKGLDPAKTHAVIVGVLTWQQRSLTKYPPEMRQDVALRDQLLARGVPKKNISLLLDKEATRTAIETAVETISKQAENDATLIVYYAGHGMLDKGEGIFACYDINTQAMQETGWRQSRLSESIIENFKGKRVLLFADCCFSGSLKNVAKTLHENGIQSASITSAAAANTSTNNWTFTHSLIETLSGEPVGDKNGDEWIGLAEAAEEVSGAMSHFEHQASGFAAEGLPKDFRLSKTDPPRWIEKSNQLHSFRRGDFVAVQRDQLLQSGRVMDARMIGSPPKPELLVQFQAYNHRPRIWVAARKVRATVNEVKDQIPIELPAEEALAKASLDGKFTELLHKLSVPDDHALYGEFNDSGFWSGSIYKGHGDLEDGYWVYVYPHWYVWDQTNVVNRPVEWNNRFLIVNPPAEVDAVPAAVVPQGAVPGAWSANQMTGKPNTPQAGDSQSAWASVTEDARKVWVELDYKNPIDPAEVHIVETYNPGAVYQVTAVIDGKEKQLWKGKDPTSVDAPMGTSKIPLNPGQPISRIRIYLDSPSVPGWNEIDAVGLVDKNQKVHWAVHARASSDYSTQKAIAFVDPFMSPEDLRREQTTRIMNEIKERKATVRQIQDNIDQMNAEIKQLYRQLDALE